MKTYLNSLSKYLVICLAVSSAFAQNIQVDVHLNIKHVIDDISEFDRKKFIVIHESLDGNDWNGEEDKMDYIIGDLDVYFGRDNGSMGWYMNQATESPTKSGFVDPNYMAQRGKYVRETVYGVNKSNRHKYEAKSDVLVGGQENPFWLGHSTNPCCGGTPWAIAGAEASGDFMGQYFNQFYKNEGEPATKGVPRPSFMEIINEPLYGLVDTGTFIPQDVFEYHNTVADAIRVHNSDILIGGYTTAFPIFEENNFKRWEDRMKLFYDVSGDKMDFFSIHLYDFNKHHINGGTAFEGPRNFKGSRIEATMDMMEQYSQLKFNTVKPFLISEYGGRDHSTEWKVWTPERDWQFMKSISPMLMQFMRRPNKILKTVPFIVLKAEWGTTNIPYPWRLFRKQKEKPGETGENWVYTELIKFYELWSDVNGTRVDIKSANLDIMVDAYVKDNKAYVILNNLNFNPETISLNLFESNTIQSIKAKHLYLNGNAPVLSETDLAPNSEIDFTLNTEATAILEYTFSENVTINNTKEETKYYATSYYKSIQAAVAETFQINAVDVSQYAFNKGVLRIGFGRDHNTSKKPVVNFNGVALEVPDNYSGDNQVLRDQFFGMLEVQVPQNLLQANNTISITFPDAGGHISSVTMQVFSSDVAIKEAGERDISVLASVKSISNACPSQTNGIITVNPLAEGTFNIAITGNGINLSENFSSIHEVSNLASGTYTVVITSVDYPNVNTQYEVTIAEPEPLSVFGKVNTDTKSVIYSLNGGENYTINFNGDTFTTTESSIELLLISGKNTVQIKADADCQGAFKDHLFFNEIVSYPNPFTESLTIDLGLEDSGTIKIYNLQGALIYNEMHHAESREIDVDTNFLNDGLYLISVETKASSKMIKGVKISSD